MSKPETQYVVLGQNYFSDGIYDWDIVDICKSEEEAFESHLFHRQNEQIVDFKIEKRIVSLVLKPKHDLESDLSR